MAYLFCSACEVQLAQLSTTERISPVPELLGTNQVPTSTEADDIKRCLSDVDSELQYLESIFSKLAARRDHLKSFADGHRALLSPARRIYPDLLSEIFARCSKGAPRKYPRKITTKIPDTFDPKQGPLLLTQICRSWRQTVIATPNIWSTIRFVLGPRSKVDLINLWLERSANCDLTIAVLEHPDSSTRADLGGLPCNEQALCILASQAHRWKSAFFFLCIGAPHWNALHGAKGKMVRLRHLTIRDPQDRGQKPIPTLFHGLTGLTSLTLSRHVFGEGLPKDGSTITHFRYEEQEGTRADCFVPIEQCLNIMRRLPNLESCLLECSMLALSEITNVTMVRLKDLKIEMAGIQARPPTPHPGVLWQALQLPNLTTLTIISSGHQVNPLPLDHEALSGLISRCPKLTSLCLSWYATEPQPLIECLRQASGVKYLKLGLYNATTFSQVLSCISQYTPSSRPLLPSLKEVHVSLLWYSYRWFPADDDFAAFAEMARRGLTNAHTHSDIASPEATLNCEPIDYAELEFQGHGVAETTLQHVLDKTRGLKSKDMDCRVVHHRNGNSTTFTVQVSRQ
ncbi:hypothetical protein EST38_g2168 [Candolleomyces aberdarensis]|uniref:F-box domain-containing protein n=1 Tax=Candolleomyces aberdarensis TaxID=2316362 RepID=A0A4Q2DTK3_9AGAR|nr:hypothetical protein EST38_g2168 [Candolleomyces aberdarensis]